MLLNRNIVLATALMSASVCAEQAPILVTGEIGSAKVQTITAPKTDRWQIQVQWMIDEGTIVKPGDLVAVFDSGSLDSQLEQNQERLETLKLELKKKTSDLAQQVVESQGRLDVAELEVEKARVEAEIESSEVSGYDKGQYELTLERALLAKIKAEQDLEAKLQQQKTELQKQEIEVVKLEENIAYQQKQLTKLKVKALVEGPVSHMYHPWNGEKITAGTTLQASMKTMEVQSNEDYEVKAWIHEIDATRINMGQTARLTLDAFPQSEYRGQIAQIASQPERKEGWGESAYYQIKIVFEQQPEQALLPGMSVRAELLSKEN